MHLSNTIRSWQLIQKMISLITNGFQTQLKLKFTNYFISINEINRNMRKFCSQLILNPNNPKDLLINLIQLIINSNKTIVIFNCNRCSNHISNSEWVLFLTRNVHFLYLLRNSLQVLFCVSVDFEFCAFQ